MRYMKMLSMLAAVLAALAVTAAHAGSNTPNAIRYGKTAITLGTWDGGPNQYQYGRTYAGPVTIASPAPVVAPAPMIAASPATGERRTFSAEPSAAAAPAPAAAVVAPTTRRAVRGQVYDRFGKGPTTSGLTPSGYSGR
jgi:hypothetical protein